MLARRPASGPGAVALCLLLGLSACVAAAQPPAKTRCRAVVVDDAPARLERLPRALVEDIAARLDRVSVARLGRTSRTMRAQAAAVSNLHRILDGRTPDAEFARLLRNPGRWACWLLADSDAITLIDRILSGTTLNPDQKRDLLRILLATQPRAGQFIRTAQVYADAQNIVLDDSGVAAPDADCLANDAPEPVRDIVRRFLAAAAPAGAPRALLQRSQDAAQTILQRLRAVDATLTVLARDGALCALARAGIRFELHRFLEEAAVEPDDVAAYVPYLHVDWGWRPHPLSRAPSRYQAALLRVSALRTRIVQSAAALARYLIAFHGEDLDGVVAVLVGYGARIDNRVWAHAIRDGDARPLSRLLLCPDVDLYAPNVPVWSSVKQRAMFMSPLQMLFLTPRLAIWFRESWTAEAAGRIFADLGEFRRQWRGLHEVMHEGPGGASLLVGFENGGGAGGHEQLFDSVREAARALHHRQCVDCKFRLICGKLVSIL